MIKDLLTLKQFIGAYFHQDWDLEHSTADDVINFYKHDVDCKTLSFLRVDIESLCGLGLDDTELQDILFNEMGCSYNYPHEWESSKAWLAHILTIISTQAYK